MQRRYEQVCTHHQSTEDEEEKKKVASLLYVREPFGLVFGGDLADQFVEAARVLQFNLGALAVEVVQVAEQRHVTVQSGIQASQLVRQLLTHVCTHTRIHTDVFNDGRS